MKYKVLYFILSLVFILPGLFFLINSGLKLGIDFTGGALLEYKFSKSVTIEDLRKNIVDQGIEIGSITDAGNNTYIIRTKPLDQSKITALKNKLIEKYSVDKSGSGVEERRVENVGPVIGAELQKKALLALGLATIAIVLYIAFSFRKVPKITSSWRFGVTAIIALLHDVLIVVGVFAILGKVMGVEIDTMFVTAILTVIGFSVHDTIVVFDRIRENLSRHIGKKFLEVANISVTQTLGRSLNTSLTLIFMMVALLLFGGESLRWFITALLIGVITGTYSSIFNATALLTWWEEKLGH